MMGLINLSRVAKSPRFTQQITVMRTLSHWVRGELVPYPSAEINMQAIVTVATPKDLQQVPEGDRMLGGMRFTTTKRLYNTAGPMKSDVVIWRGAKYKILTVTPDVDYGFYHAVGTRLEGDGIG